MKEGDRLIYCGIPKMDYRIVIQIIKIDHDGGAYFKKYPSTESDKLFYSTVEEMKKIFKPDINLNKVKFIYKRRASTFKPR